MQAAAVPVVFLTASLCLVEAGHGGLPGAPGPEGRLVVHGLSDAVRGTRRSWLRAALAWARTPRFHPLSLIEPSIGAGSLSPVD